MMNPDTPNTTPTHIAIIMDGNGRWANARNLPRNDGHKAGVTALQKAIKASLKNQISYLSVYTFSTENWKRPKQEVLFLMTLLSKSIIKELPTLMKQNIKVKFIGNLTPLDTPLKKSIQLLEKNTQKNTQLQLNIMLNYGARDEITHAVNQLIQSPPKRPITEQEFSSYLYTSEIPDPDIMIRTGGETRLSNFMLWQLSYTELFFSPTLWPDFSEQEFNSILDKYAHIERRIGAINP